MFYVSAIISVLLFVTNTKYKRRRIPNADSTTASCWLETERQSSTCDLMWWMWWGWVRGVALSVTVSQPSSHCTWKASISPQGWHHLWQGTGSPHGLITNIEMIPPTRGESKCLTRKVPCHCAIWTVVCSCSTLEDVWLELNIWGTTL